MEWTDISITVAKRDADTAEAIATMVANGGIYIEDYSDLEQQAWEIAHVDLIEQELLDKPRDVVIVHMYLAPDENPAEVLPLFEERLKNSGIDYKLNTTGVEQEDWQNAWKKYYHAMDIGKRLAIVPGWEEHDTDRIKIIMDPGMAFGTGTHETTSLCLETLDSLVKGGERVLDIGTGSGILAIAALKLGAGSAEGVDVAPPAATDEVVHDRRALTLLVRNALFARVRLAAFGATDELGRLDAEWGWRKPVWDQALAHFHDEHEEIILDGDARSAAYYTIDESDEKRPREDGGHVWHVHQVFRDSDDDRDFGIWADVDLDATQEEGAVVFANYRVGFVDD